MPGSGRATKISTEKTGARHPISDYKKLVRTVENVFLTTKIVAFERYNFVCLKQQKNKSLEQFNANFVELASHASCADREVE